MSRPTSPIIIDDDAPAGSPPPFPMPPFNARIENPFTIPMEIHHVSMVPHGNIIMARWVLTIELPIDQAMPGEVTIQPVTPPATEPRAPPFPPPPPGPEANRRRAREAQLMRERHARRWLRTNTYTLQGLIDGTFTTPTPPPSPPSSPAGSLMAPESVDPDADTVSDVSEDLMERVAEIDRAVNAGVLHRIDAAAAFESREITADDMADADGGEAPACPICMEAVALGERVTVLPCSNHHWYHRECISEWLANSTTCPSCRHQLNEYLGENAVL